jgi:hypothetical protein
LGTPDQPLWEFTPVHFFAFLMGIPCGIVFYSLLAFTVLSLIEKTQDAGKGDTRNRCPGLARLDSRSETEVDPATPTGE